MKFVGTIASGLSGSMGGVVASHNRFGGYFRQRVPPVNTNTSFQQTVRNTFQTYAARWSSILTLDQRNLWDSYAAGVGGDLTGLNLYIRVNTARVQALLTTVDDAPAIQTLDTFTPVTATYSEAGGVINVAYTNTDAWANEVGGALSVLASRPFSSSINFFNGPYRFAGRVAGAVIPPVSPAGLTPPFLAQEDQKIGLHVRSIRADGRISNPQQLTLIVAA